MNRKHYFKLADYLGTFKYHLENFLKNNEIDFNAKEDLSSEFIGLKDNITTLLKEDNKLFNFDLFDNEIDKVMHIREKEYKEEKKIKLLEKIFNQDTLNKFNDRNEKENLRLMDMEDGTRKL